jgi:hypothetical protein
VKKIIILLPALLLSSAFAMSDLHLGARPQAMGGAYTALANDANASYYNPAGLANCKTGEAMFMHWMFSEVEQVSVDYLALSYPLKSGALGFAWARKGATLEEGINNTESTMSENDLYVSYGMNLIDNLSAGMSLKRTSISSKIGDGSGLGFDAGLIYKPIKAHNWTIGAAGKNLLTDMKDEMVDPFYSFGTAYAIGFSENMHNLAVALDVTTKEDINESEGMNIKFATGLEYALNYSDYSFAVRGGINSNAASAGFGIAWNYLAFDYAIVLMSEDTIGDSHKFGIVWKFRQPGE